MDNYAYKLEKYQNKINKLRAGAGKTREHTGDGGLMEVIGDNSKYNKYYEEGLTSFKKRYQVKHETDYQKALEQAILKDLPIKKINKGTFVNYPDKIQFIRNINGKYNDEILTCWPSSSPKPKPKPK